MATPLKRHPIAELCAHGTGRSHTTPWAVNYLDQCLYSIAADPEAQEVASVMQYLAHSWFVHQRAFLGASLSDSNRDALDDLVRQSRH